jgi:FkbM family methyltransferase
VRAIFGPEHQPRLITAFFGEGYRGTFVDVGAADAQRNSQTYDIEQAGWSGVLIEPRPDCAEQLRRDRRSPVFEFACSSPTRAGTTMTLHLAGGHSSLNEKFVVAGLAAKGEVTVAVRTLDQILNEAGVTAPIDLVSIDVEGHEPEVLAGFDLARWRPRLLVIEDHVLNLRLHRLLQSRGYKWVQRVDFNGWYVPSDHPMQVRGFGRLQFFRKYYLSLPTRWFRDGLRRLRAYTGIRPPQR